VRDGAHGQWRLRIACTPEALHIEVAREGQQPPAQDDLILLLPARDMRALSFGGAVLLHDATDGDWRQLTLTLQQQPI
jgi:alpha-glucosidase